MKKQASTPWWAQAAGVLAVVGALGIGGYLAWSGRHASTSVPASSTIGAPASSSAAAPIQHPIEVAETAVPDTGAPLPLLEDSDGAVLEGLGALLGGDALGALLNPQHVIQRIVVTIDNLPRQKLALDSIPVRGAQGAFTTAADGDRRAIGEQNAARYAPYARVAQAVDAKTLVAWYVRYYPLFQESYRQIGYPDGYFNDRLIEVIDHLLATPEPAQPVALAQPNVMYEYADPMLESRSAGQKLLMRSGPENEAMIKAKLREIRATLTGQTLPQPEPAAQ